MDDINKSNEDKSKPKYGVISNCSYMLRLSLTIGKSIIILCILFAIMSVLPNILQLFALPTILSGIENHVSLAEMIKTILVFLVGMMVVSAIKAYIQQLKLFGRISVRSELTNQINEKLCMTSYPNLDNQDFIKMMNKAQRATASNSDATEDIWNTFSSILQNVIGFVVYIMMLSSLNLYIIIITLVTAVAAYFINTYLGGWRYRHRKEEAEFNNKMYYIANNLKRRSYAKDIRIFSMRPWIEGIFNSALSAYQCFINKSEKIYFIANITEVILNILRNGVAYVYLVFMVVDGKIDVSQFLLYFTAVGGFTEWINGIFSSLNKLHRQSLDISTLREFLEHEEMFKFEEGEQLQVDMSKPYELQLKNVSFKYPEADSYTLKNINVTIKNGEKIAVVGTNGAGKTTLVKLICGLLEPVEGEILLNGINIKQYNRRDYYNHFSAVFQDFSCLAASITENVAQSIDDVDYDRVKSCIEKAGMTKKVESLPNKYNEYIGKEVYETAIDLSGGEMQRLMLARALYKEAPIIVLDEPTAALDPIAERDIYNKYNELTNGRTSVYISHRLASTRFCDRILLIDKNVISEEGTHEELLECGGIYRNMFDIQSQYYKEGETSHE